MTPLRTLLLLLAACNGVAPSNKPACAGHGDFGYPLAVHEGCLVAASGAPVWLQGEAAWSLIVRLDDAELDRYLADRKSRGFNALLVNLLEHKFADAPPKDRAGNAPFVDKPFGTPNEAYFAHVDHVLERAKDFTILLAPAYLGHNGGDEGWYAEVVAAGGKAMNAYGKYLAERYRNTPNIIWVEGGDAPPMAAVVEIEALVDGLGTDHLHTAHSARGASALDDYDKPWLSINTTYSDCRRVAMNVEADARRPRVMPSFFIEGTYEGEGAPLSCTIAQAYRSLLSGAQGHVFGNKPMWLFDKGWPSALDSEGARAMQHLAELRRTYDLTGLQADLQHRIVGAYPHSVAAASNAHAVVAFVEQPSVIQIVALPWMATARWFDPATGETRVLGDYPAGESIGLNVQPGVLLVTVK
jgi:hypothetical protein